MSRRYERVLPAPIAAVIHQMLTGVVQSGTGTSAAIPGVDVAGKTGTTTNYADAWFVGWTPQLTTAVWVGYPNKLVPMNTQYNGAPVEGGTYPAIIWHNFMVQALQILASENPHRRSRPRRRPIRRARPEPPGGVGLGCDPDIDQARPTTGRHRRYRNTGGGRPAAGGGGGGTGGGGHRRGRRHGRWRNGPAAVAARPDGGGGGGAAGHRRRHRRRRHRRWRRRRLGVGGAGLGGGAPSGRLAAPALAPTARRADSAAGRDRNRLPVALNRHGNSTAFVIPIRRLDDDLYVPPCSRPVARDHDRASQQVGAVQLEADLRAPG